MTESGARHVIWRGEVQGVGFRVSVFREARRLGLTGWVRNRTDRSVEALLVGDATSIDALLARLLADRRDQIREAIDSTTTAPTHPAFEIVATVTTDSPRAAPPATAASKT
ncbi:MAG: acylphosphatase [Planctomycetes bacterium]|nr:acylphosphatase [Planctomycetota bacterium]